MELGWAATRGGDLIGTAVAYYALYANFTGPIAGAMLGLAGAWIGLTIQHCGNHGAEPRRG